MKATEELASRVENFEDWLLDRDTLTEVFYALYPTSNPRKLSQFITLWELGAPVEAAASLLPEGVCWQITYNPRGSRATVYSNSSLAQYHTVANNPGLALAATAIQAAHAEDWESSTLQEEAKP